MSKKFKVDVAALMAETARINSKNMYLQIAAFSAFTLVILAFLSSIS